MVVQCHKHVLLSIYISTLMSTQKVIWSCLIMAGVCSVMSYTLLLSLIEYKTLVLRGDFQRAQEVLPTIPIEHLNSLARFLESRGMLEDALEIATDPDYKLDLAVQLGTLEIAKLLLKKPRVNPNGSNSGYKEHRMVLEKYNRKS
ncbi:hypothetical protein CY35_04G020800 [Sphagnum magellanicum]|nr:hypothetical protein CY35_04G020800 [Sphagnum magellanicum]